MLQFAWSLDFVALWLTCIILYMGWLEMCWYLLAAYLVSPEMLNQQQERAHTRSLYCGLSGMTFSHRWITVKFYSCNLYSLVAYLIVFVSGFPCSEKYPEWFCGFLYCPQQTPPQVCI